MKKFFSKRPLKGRDPWKLRKAKNFFFSGPTDSFLGKLQIQSLLKNTDGLSK